MAGWGGRVAFALLQRAKGVLSPAARNVMQNKVPARLGSDGVRFVHLFPCESCPTFEHAFPWVSNTAWSGDKWETCFWHVLIYTALLPSTDAALHVSLHTGFVSRRGPWLSNAHLGTPHSRLWILPIPRTAFMNTLNAYRSSTFWEDYYKPCLII